MDDSEVGLGLALVLRFGRLKESLHVLKEALYFLAFFEDQGLLREGVVAFVDVLFLVHLNEVLNVERLGFVLIEVLLLLPRVVPHELVELSVFLLL